MITKEILESHPVSVLKKEISKTNIKGYSKMKKSGIVSLMLKPEHSKRFSHIKKAEKKGKKEAPKKIIIKRTPKPAAPEKKRMLSPLEDIKEYLNNVNSKEYKLLKANKNPSGNDKSWLEVLTKKLNKVLDSDIPINVNNVFTKNKLMEYKTLKELPDKILYDEDEIMGLSVFDAIKSIFLINKKQGDLSTDKKLTDKQKERNRLSNILIAIKREGKQKVNRIIKINESREKLCSLYDDKFYQKTATKEKKKEITQTIKLLSSQLKDELKFFTTNLYFVGGMCPLRDLPAGLQKMINEKLINKGNKKPADFGGELSFIKNNSRKAF